MSQQTMSTLFPIIIVAVILYFVFARKSSGSKGTSSSAEASLWTNRHIEFVSELKNPLSTAPFRMQPGPAIQRGVVLMKNEELIVDAPVKMFRTVKTGAQWKSGSRGVRVTPVKGLSFNVGGSRGRMQATYSSDMELGYFTMTNKRLIFTGDNNFRFAIPLTKLDNVSKDESIIHFDVKSRDVPDFGICFIDSAIATMFSSLLSDDQQSFNFNFIA